MKKAYFFLPLTILSAFAFAQEKQPLSMPDNKTQDVINERYKHRITHKADSSSWFSHIDGYTNVFSSTPEGNGNFMFPDSTILVDYGASGYSGPWIHQIGQVYDINELVFSGHHIRTHADFMIDSMEINGYYSRVNPNSVDTLEISIFQPGRGNLNSVFYFSTMTHLADTVRFSGFDWDFATLSTPGAIATYKVVLDAAFFADSIQAGTSFYHAALIDNGVNGAINDTIFADVVNSGYQGIFGVTARFIPGYVHAATDTLGVNQNSWTFFSAELEGSNSFPNYIKNDYNCSYILPTDVRYNLSGGWNNSLIPSFAYMGDPSSASYGYESMDFRLKLAQDDKFIGVAENNASKISFNVFPNPTQGNATITLKAIEQAQQVVVSVSNMLGEEVYNRAFSVQDVLRQNIDLTSYGAGVYFISVVNEGVRNTQRLIVH